MADPSIPQDLQELMADEIKATQLVLSGDGHRVSLVIAFVSSDDLMLSAKAYSREMDRGELRAMLQLLDHQRAALEAMLDG